MSNGGGAGDFLANLFLGATGEMERRRKGREEHQSKLAEILETARAKGLAEQEFPSAEEQARRRSLELITQLVQPRFGQGLIGPPTFGEEQAVGTRQRELEGLMSLLGRTQPLGQGRNITQTVEALRSLGLQPSGATISPTGEPTWRFAPPRPPPGAAKAAAVVQQARASQAQINEIFSIAKRDLPAMTIPGIPLPEGVEAIWGGIGRKAAAVTGFDEAARSFLEIQVANARQTIRGLGEVGVLTDRDVDDAIRLLPASTDGPTVRRNKLENLNRLIEAKIRVYETKNVPVESTPSDADFIAQLEAQGYQVEPIQ